MADATQHAQTIYDAIRATSADRPFAFQSLEQLQRGVASWQAQNAALTTLRQASPDVQTAFLGRSVEWLKHESADHANFRVISTLVDAILHAINAMRSQVTCGQSSGAFFRTMHFAGISMRQHQFSSLCRARGWNYRLMGVGFDGFNVPTKILAPWNMHVEFYVDLRPDRGAAPRVPALDEQSASGINLFLGSDQVRFYRNRREIAVDDVPAIVYSEVMRDVDLFTTVCAAGEDRTWSDQGERGTGVLTPRFDVDELTAIIALRVELLSRVLPLTPIASRCTLEKSCLEVRGELGTYRIQFAWGRVGRVTDSGLLQPLNIPRHVLDDVSADFSAFPIDLDHRTEMILRKAYVLANDGQIDSPDLIRQL